MRIAIIGSGVSGIAATWALNEHSEHQVNLYEAGDYFGGHTHTVTFKRPGKEEVDVDTGFIVCNPPTYPNFLAFLKEKAVQTLPTVMSFSVTRDRGVFEWAGKGVASVFVQPQNLFNPRVYRMLFDIFRFNLFALDVVRGDQDPSRAQSSGSGHNGTAQSKNADLGEWADGEMSIGEYLDKEGFGDGFKEDYLLPMTAAIWSTPADKCALDFPAKTLIRFFHNHHLLQIDGHPKWLTVKGGAKHYVDSVLSKMKPEHLHLRSKIVAVTPHENHVTLKEANGSYHDYDYVILATHSNTALELLKAGGGATKQEENILGSFEWSKNEAVLHWDEKFMPVHKAAWAAWNYLTLTGKKSEKKGSAASDVNTVSLTYDMNQLQSIPESKYGPVLVTLNPPFQVNPHKVVGRYKYDHPMYSAKSVRAQYRLPTIQNVRRVSFAGAWTNYGFHEDGFTSGLKVAVELFGAKIPFEIKPANREIKIQSTSRAVVSHLEVARRVVFESAIGLMAWTYLCWFVVLGTACSRQIVHILPLGDPSKAGMDKNLQAIERIWQKAGEVKR